jgi:hypothetical protein
MKQSSTSVGTWTLRKTAVDMQKTHMFIQELPLSDEGFGVWWAVNASGISGSSLLSDQNLSPFCNAQSDSSSCPNVRELAPFYSARLCNSSLLRKRLHALVCTMFLVAEFVTFVLVRPETVQLILVCGVCWRIKSAVMIVAVKTTWRKSFGFTGRSSTCNEQNDFWGF